MMQPCLDCGTPSHASRCQLHTKQNNTQKNRKQTAGRQGGRGYGPGWKQRSAIIRATATRCHICGQGPRPNDPWQADHIIPIQHGGKDGPIAPAHRSCNIAKGNRTRHQQPNTPHTPPPPTPTHAPNTQHTTHNTPHR